MSRRTLGVMALLVFIASTVPLVQAQSNITVGGHIGFVVPWVTHEDGRTTSIADNFGMGFPIGVTFKGKGRMALDLEMVPSISSSPHEVTLQLILVLYGVLIMGWQSVYGRLSMLILRGLALFLW